MDVNQGQKNKASDWNDATTNAKVLHASTYEKMFFPVENNLFLLSILVVIIVKVIFISSFLFYCLLFNHSFPTNPKQDY